MGTSIRYGAASLVALSLVSLALGWWLIREEGEASRTHAPKPTSATPVRTLDDLPQGGSADVAYALGSMLVVGDREVRLETKPLTLLESASTVIVRYGSGAIDRVDKESLRVDRLADASSGAPIVDPGGNFVAWQAAGSGRAEVLVYSLHDPATFLDRQTFPATPSCCDNPFQVLGVTQYGDLYVSLPGLGQAWFWNIYEGHEGIPHEVPDSDDYVRPIRGLAGGQLGQVTANEIVVVHLPRAKGDATVFLSGDASDGSFSATQRVEAVDADFRDPRARRIVYWTNDGLGHIAARTSGPGAGDEGIDAGEAITLGLPASIDVWDLFWEDADHFVLDVDDTTSQQRALVRCDARSGECETAGWLKRNAVIAHS